MIGQLILTCQGRGRTQPGRLYGLPVLRAETDPTGFWGERRLLRAGKGLRRGGAGRVLVPKNFVQWPLLERFGLRRVDPEAFVRAQSVPLALKLLERRGLPPDRAVVALRGLRADRDMARTAARLCQKVCGLVVDVPRGGEELAAWLRWEFGIPVLPPGETCHASLRFHADCPRREKEALELYGPRPRLAGLRLSAPGLEERDREDLPLLSALWEGGKLGLGDIKIT